MLPRASSTSWKRTTAASLPTASAWGRHSPLWPSSSITSFAIVPSLCSVPRSWPTTGSLSTATLREKLGVGKDIEEIFRRAQAVFNAWSKLPPEQRTAETILEQLDFDFFEVLDSVTIARSRKHIETFYDTADIGSFPERRKPISVHCQLTHRTDVIGFNEIFTQLSMLQLAVYAPLSYILPSRVAKYAALYDTEVRGGGGTLRQADRERSLQGLMTI